MTLAMSASGTQETANPAAVGLLTEMLPTKNARVERFCP
jgi:hypothetical protein